MIMQVQAAPAACRLSLHGWRAIDMKAVLLSTLVCCADAMAVVYVT
jgi:hypothetical protein